MSETENKKITTVYIAPSLHREFKRWCLRNDMKLTDAIEDMIRQRLNKTEEVEADRDVEITQLTKSFVNLKNEYSKLAKKLQDGKKIWEAWKSIGDGITPDRRRQMIPDLAKKLGGDKNFNISSEVVIFARMAEIQYEMEQILRKLGVSRESKLGNDETTGTAS